MKNHFYFGSILLSALFFFSVTLNAQIFSKTNITATIAGISNAEISKEQLLNSATILCTNPKFEVIHFNLSLLHKNGDIIAYTGRGNTLNESMKAQIRNMEIGSKLLIEDIGALSIEKKTIKIQPITLIIK